MTEAEFGQEYLCEFHEVDGGIFDPAAVRDMVDENVTELVIDSRSETGPGGQAGRPVPLLISQPLLQEAWPLPTPRSRRRSPSDS